MLVSISDELLTVGRAAGARRRTRRARRCAALVDWHVSFALDHKALIVVQDRDWAALPLEAREKVRETQRKYVEVWVKQLRAIHPDLAPKPARAERARGLRAAQLHPAQRLPAGRGDAPSCSPQMAARALGQSTAPAAQAA